MRTLRRLSALALLLLAAACDENPTSSGDGRMRARLEGDLWNGDAEVFFLQDTVVLQSKAPLDVSKVNFSGTTSSWRSLVLYLVASGPGEYQVVPGKGGYEEILQGDMVTYAARVTAGTVRFTILGQGQEVAEGRVDDVRIEGSSGVWSFDEGGFTAEVRQF
ncbi:MAG TPA: hypothetical protein VLK84_06320 [Longimicrobium sp.]|nr:hypothetical protein [Longimicrobium sp.]